jgi:hypothetical protein
MMTVHDTNNKPTVASRGTSTATQKPCPLIDNSQENCWFNNPTSANIPKIVDLCGGRNYEKCELYRNHLDLL